MVLIIGTRQFSRKGHAVANVMKEPHKLKFALEFIYR